MRHLAAGQLPESWPPLHPGGGAQGVGHKKIKKEDHVLPPLHSWTRCADGGPTPGRRRPGTTTWSTLGGLRQEQTPSLAATALASLHNPRTRRSLTQWWSSPTPLVLDQQLRTGYHFETSKGGGGKSTLTPTSWLRRWQGRADHHHNLQLFPSYEKVGDLPSASSGPHRRAQSGRRVRHE